jgi:predicted TIM-barrel enzyme
MKFHDNFPGKKKVFLAVIHLRDVQEDNKEALRNIDAAVQGGADGILLINQHPSSDMDHILETAFSASNKYPDLWIGANFLSYAPNEITENLPICISGVWIDDGEIDETSIKQPRAENVKRCFDSLGGFWKGLHFGGVAFKYQAPVKSCAMAAKAAIGLMDVITTSGPGTGLIAEISKIKEMREAIGDYPFALASGVTSDNINDYLPYVDCFIIGTAIETAPFRVSEEKVREIREKIDQFLL